MATVEINVAYHRNKEVPLKDVKSGNSVLLKNPEGRVVSYIVNKVGTTPLKIMDSSRPILLTNLETGRVVAKQPKLPCVPTDSRVTLYELN